jgi:hypothetical protein
VVLQREAHLTHLVAALRPTGRFTGRLHGRQQQGDQDANDRDHYQQLDQSEASGRGASAYEGGRVHVAVSPKIGRVGSQLEG